MILALDMKVDMLVLHTCMILRVKVIVVPLRINMSEHKPPRYPMIAITLHGTALNQAACLRST